MYFIKLKFNQSGSSEAKSGFVSCLFAGSRAQQLRPGIQPGYMRQYRMLTVDLATIRTGPRNGLCLGKPAVGNGEVVIKGELDRASPGLLLKYQPILNSDLSC